MEMEVLIGLRRQIENSGRNILAEFLVMLHKQHRRGILQQQFFNLHID